MVNTFLPYKNFRKCAKILDTQRLNKQITEAYQILDGCLDDGYAWSKHPACGIWRGCESELCYYILCCIDEWHNRGYKSHRFDKYNLYIDKLNKINKIYKKYTPTVYLRLTHKSNLYRKFWEKFFKIMKSKKYKQLKKLPFQYLRFWYAGFGLLEYWWPGKENNKILRWRK